VIKCKPLDLPPDVAQAFVADSRLAVGRKGAKSWLG
jgi:hypothetical protein